MAKYIDKSALVAEIEKRRDSFYSLSKSCEKGTPAKAGFYAQAQTLEGILSFLDTLEVKEVYECNDVDLNPLFEEMGVEPDSRIALMFKNAFYKSVDNYLDKKENKV